MALMTCPTCGGLGEWDECLPSRDHRVEPECALILCGRCQGTGVVGSGAAPDHAVSDALGMDPPARRAAAALSDEALALNAIEDPVAGKASPTNATIPARTAAKDVKR